MPSLTRIFGWAPSKNEAYIDVVPRQHAQQNPTFHISEPISSRRSVSSHSSAMFEETSPASSTSSLYPDNELVEKKPDISRRGDPSWVARPRNAFLIFRCQYSRENCKPGKRVRRPPGSQPEKTLSKRAAEAWHQLPAKEKERYKVLAEEEGKEHARLHPDYRFRPMRRSGGQRRSTRSVSARGPTTSDAPSSHPPPRQRGTSPNSLADLPQSLVDSYALKASRRRSVSVPVPLDQQPHIVPSDVDFQPQLSKLLQRRSKSMTEGWMSLQIPASSSRLWSDECLSPWDEPPHPSRVYDPESPYSSGFTSPGIHFPDFSTPEYSPIEATSGLASSSSSLLNWNGEYTSRGPGLQPLNLSQYSIPLSPLPGAEFNLNALVQLPEFAYPCESQLTGEQPGYHVSDETWMSQISQYVPSSGMHVSVGTSDMDMDMNTIADSTIVYDSNGGYNGIQDYGMTDSLSGGILANNEIRDHDSLFLAENNSYYPAY